MAMNSTTARAAFVAAQTGDKAALDWISTAMAEPAFWDLCTGLVTDAPVAADAAAALHAMARRSWRALSPQVQSERLSRLSAGIDAMARGGIASAPTTLRFLAQAFACAASLSPPPALSAYLVLATGLGGDAIAAGPASDTYAGLVFVSVELLSALCSECISKPHINRRAAAGAVQKRLPAVLAVLQAGCAPHAASPLVPCGRGTPDGLQPLGKAALTCIRAVGDMSGHVVRLSELAAHRSDLLMACIAGICSSDPAISRTACITLAELVQAPSPADAARDISAAAPPSADAASLSALCTALGGLRSRLVSAMEEHDERAQDSLCRACVTAIERRVEVGEAEAATGQMASALLLLRSAMDSTFATVRHTACEVWPALAAAPAGVREALLPAGGMGDLISSVLRGSSYPEGFVTWADQDEDEDVFLDFREQGAANAMHACYTVQPAHFFGVLGGIMEHAGDGGWQSVESVVFATRCVGMEVKRRLRGLGAVTRTASAATDASTAGTIASARSELEATNSFLRNLFNAIGSQSGVVTASPTIIQGCCRCISAYAAWISPHPDLTTGTVAFAIKALALAEARSAAAQALSTLAVRSSAQLAASSATFLPALRDALGGIIDELLGATVGAVAATETLDSIVNTGMRVCSKMPSGALTAALATLQPITERLSKASAVPPAGVARLIHAAATAVRFSSFAVDSGAKPVGTAGAAAMTESLWPLVASAAGAHGPALAEGYSDAQEEVVIAVGESIGTMVRTAGSALGPSLPGLVEAALSGFKSTGVHSCVEAVSAVCEQFGPAGSDAIQGRIRGWLDDVLAISLPTITAAFAGPSDTAAAAAAAAAAGGGRGGGRAAAAKPRGALGSPETALAVTELLRIAAIFAPTALCRCSGLPAAVSSARALVRSRHPSIVSASVSLVARLGAQCAPAASPSVMAGTSASQIEACRPVLWAAVAPEAPAIVQSLALAACVPSNPHMLDTAASALFHTLRASVAATVRSGAAPTADPCVLAFSSVMASSDVAIKAPELNAERRRAEASALLGLAISTSAGAEESFQQRCSVVFRVCRGEAALESLAVA